ncbi:MAG TPA: hypothetical protein VII58_07905 [Acidobacteriaceae bacterium]
MSTELKVADAVWIATALLQKKNPDGEFDVPEIVDRTMREHLTDKPRTTIYLHANQHCVANRPPNAARLRMLIETPSGNRRLFREGDEYHPLRRNARSMPVPQDVPSKYRSLFSWYRDWSAGHARPWEETDPLMRLAGTWKYGDADEYVRKLREGWD